MTYDEHEPIRQSRRRTFGSSEVLDERLHQPSSSRRKVEDVGLELLVMPFEEGRLPRSLAGCEYDFECLLELIRFAITAALAQWKVYPIPGLHEDFLRTSRK